MPAAQFADLLWAPLQKELQTPDSEIRPVTMATLSQ
jgi:hypothetical protein